MLAAYIIRKIHPDDGGSNQLKKNGILPPGHMAQEERRQPSSNLPLQESEISQVYFYP
jgi:hypothetical protein